MCREGFYKRFDACLKCTFDPTKCLDCSSERICTKCAPGHALRNFIGDDGEASSKCVECPTEDGCETCGGNKCLTCRPGYFLTEDGLCHECKAAQDGCELCDNMYTCQKCSAIGFLLDPGTNECKCDLAQGFRWNKEKLKCECSLNTFNIEAVPQKSNAPVKYNYSPQK